VHHPIKNNFFIMNYSTLVLYMSHVYSIILSVPEFTNAVENEPEL